MKTVDFYFDPISPYSWLAWTQLAGVSERTGSRFRAVPVLFAGLLNAGGQKGPAEIPSKRVYTFKDAARWAMRYGKHFEGPPAHPFNPLRALRLCTSVEDDDDRLELAGAIFDAVWSRGLDVTKDSVLLDLARRVGLDGEVFLRMSGEQGTKDRLRKQTDAAVAAGVFGVPTFAVDGELFWGNDRLPLLEEHLKGGLRIDAAKMETILARPRASDRPGV